MGQTDVLENISMHLVRSIERYSLSQVAKTMELWAAHLIDMVRAHSKSFFCASLSVICVVYYNVPLLGIQNVC